VVKSASWPKERLDYFILEQLEAHQLNPAHEAERRTLIRRVTLDLTGIIPAPQQVESFVNDPRPDAYEIKVEELLEQRAFGERMASLWLNLARYAEDQAHQVGNNTSLNFPNAYKYRDWVIGAFNADVPYDAFLKKQLAVDLLEPGNSRDLVALGFLGLGHKLYNRSRTDVQAEEWAEKVDTVSQTMLGLTVACARCHDHKFDPITTRDYYAMAGVFASLKMVNLKPDGTEEKNDAKADQMDAGTIHVVRDDSPHDLPIYERGDVESAGALAPRSYLQVLSKGEPKRFQQGSGRAELACLIADGANPLTARVMVNRLWDQFFGKPLVRTSSNFGAMGEKPSHPKLLDDLAVRFVSEGWSIKKLIREFVLSATYRQDSRGSAADAQLDPANTYFWRMERRRMSVEQIRDSVLEASGTLSLEGGKSADIDSNTNTRRTVYAKVSRRELNKTLMLFDYPDANVHAGRRTTSITPIQKLFALNSNFMLEQSKTLAIRLCSMKVGDETRIRRAYELLFSREPEKQELNLSLEFLGKTSADTSMTNWHQFAHALLATDEMIYVD
jgi:hypothetical protein